MTSDEREASWALSSVNVQRGHLSNEEPTLAYLVHNRPPRCYYISKISLLYLFSNFFTSSSFIFVIIPTLSRRIP